MTYDHAPRRPIVRLLERDMGNGRILYNKFLRMASRDLGNFHDAEDLVSAFVTKVIEQADTYRDLVDWSNPNGDQGVMMWLSRVYRSCRIDYYRTIGAKKRGPRRKASLDAWDDWPVEASYEEPKPGEGQELGELLREAISRLHPRYSTVANLVYLEGLSHEETSKVLSIPLGTVKSRTHKLKKLLAEELALESRVA